MTRGILTILAYVIAKGDDPGIFKKSPTGPTERTPTPEYLMARWQLTERGPLLRSHSIFDGYCFHHNG